MGETWEASAACRNHTDIFHSVYLDYATRDHTFLGLPETPREALAKQAEVRAEAKKVCASCPAAVDCAIWALQNPFYGIAAGMTPKDAADLREQHTIKVHEITAAQMAEYTGVAEHHGGKHMVQASQVMRLVEQGWTNKQIAEFFNVSVRTVIRVRVEARSDENVVIEGEQPDPADRVRYASEEKIEDVAFDIVDAMVAAARRDAVAAAAPAPATRFVSVPDAVTVVTEQPTTLANMVVADTPTVTVAPVATASGEVCPTVPQPRPDSAPLLTGKKVQVNRLSPAMRTVWDLLADGAWHHLDEIVAVASPLITDDEAAKAYLSSRRDYAGTMSHADIVTMGRRVKVLNSVSAASRLRPTMERNGDWFRATANALASLPARAAV